MIIRVLCQNTHRCHLRYAMHLFQIKIHCFYISESLGLFFHTCLNQTLNDLHNCPNYTYVLNPPANVLIKVP